ncbi:hypothetical protein llap_12670 [Limosa lapponica baueri]|uniref:Uncharacterized protein n=1 Tax=Limosa lapponica baueri TaxID=1758121 RepID=A0A2I0TTB5_LIMLA|nr:hypothetical protein llap_12670 [Limosa lapponica baueri]
MQGLVPPYPNEVSRADQGQVQPRVQIIRKLVMMKQVQDQARKSIHKSRLGMDDDHVTSRHLESPSLDSVTNGNWTLDLDSGSHRLGLKVLLCPALQPVQVTLDGGTALWSVGQPSQFGIISKLAGDTLCPVVQVIDEYVEQLVKQLVKTT